MGQLVSEQEVQFYDIAVSDWPGEIDFYREMAIEVKEQGGSILELGCGTGRVTLRFAQEGVSVMGLDYSPAMIAMARQKSQGLSNVRWVEGDMAAFELHERFNLIIIPGHSFQFMLNPPDQIACLECIRHHLAVGGMLVVHLNHDDPSWLGGLSRGEGTGFKLAGEYRQGPMGYFIRQWNAWSYEASTQTASAVTAWETIAENGSVIERQETVKKSLHCFSRFEMEHLLARTGFGIEALYGDFSRQEFHDTSPEMIWIASVE
jgi:ubiquinone/menaquinone biosynthesis C-methylase UbiE